MCHLRFLICVFCLYVGAAGFAQEQAVESVDNAATAVEAEASPTQANPDKTTSEETEPSPSDAAEETQASEPPESDEVADAEAAEEEAVVVDAEAEQGVDWMGLIERAPALIAVTHRAAVHMPIGLWVLGGFFVVVGVVVPSWRNQIPLACLIGGALTSVAAAASGWWYAEYEWGETWAMGDNLGDFSELLVQHRWAGVSMAAVSLVLSVIALISQAKKSKSLGAIWRIGLLGLALAVGWVGHIGGEMTVGEGFLEEAIELWLTPEE